MNPPPAPLPVRPRRSIGARRVVAVLAAAALLGTAACDSGDSGGDGGPQRGGTLRVSLLSWPGFLDPQRVQTAWESNISNLVTRTLTGFRPEPGEAGSELVPDLATDTGRPSENNTVWEFTLKDGVRWEDGEPVTCQDLKYGVERRFSDLADRQSGPSYPLEYLVDNPAPEGSEGGGRVYQGPWVGNNNDGSGLESVECVDQRLIRYHLNQPRSDFNYTVSLAVFGPVRPGADDDRDAYNRQPLSSGPYRVAEHVHDPDAPADNQLVLERNPHWDASTDPHRPAYPDRIEFTQTGDVAVTTNDLINDQGDDRSRILLDWDIAPTFLQQVMTEPDLARRVAEGPMGAVRYLALNTRQIPDVRCRQALAFAMNKRKFRSVFGGSLLGDLATSMIPPNLKAHADFDHYGTEEFPEGQPDRAREILAEVEEEQGEPCFDGPVTFSHPDTAEIRRLATVVVESYQLIGVQVQTVPIEPGAYFGAVLGERHGEFHLSWVGWVPDWPNGSAVIPPLFEGCDDCAGTYNLSYLNDQQVNDMIDTAFAETDLERQYLLWGELDSRIQELAATIPLLYMDALRMYGSNVRGAFIHPQYAMPDLSAIGLADPALSTQSQE